MPHAKRYVQTQDGSVTLYSETFGEAYHSIKDGALRESLLKHVRPALELSQGKSRLRILDICFGLGYNTLATLYELRRRRLSIEVHIVSPETDEALVRSLKAFDYPPEFTDLRPVTEAISTHLCYRDDQISIEVLIGDARQLVRQHNYAFDIVYQDPFSPKVNPLLWTQEWFADIRAHCCNDAVLTTYSVAAATRMGLHANGFLLYDYAPQGTRRSLIASLQPICDAIPGLTPIDMELKIQRNPHARALNDTDFQF